MPFLENKDYSLRVPVYMKGSSLVVYGAIRNVSAVNVRAVNIPDPSLYTSSTRGWSEKNGHLVCHTMQKTCLDPGAAYSEYKCRTTLFKTGDPKVVQWKAHETNVEWQKLENKEVALSNKHLDCVAIFSKEIVSLDSLGLQQDVQPYQASAQSSARQQAIEVDQEFDVPEEFSFGQEQALPEELAKAVPLVAPPILHGVVRDGMAQDAAQEAENFHVEGVSISSESSQRTLRAARKSLGISSSGCKAKLFGRIKERFDKLLRIDLTREAALKAKDFSERDVETMPLASPPSQKEIEQHELTHAPYQAWCTSCVMARGRQDKCLIDEGRKKDRETPTISMDFCYAGYDQGLPGGPVLEAEDNKLTCLVLHDSTTSCVHAVPVDRKGNLGFLCGEVIRFISYLGYGEVILKNDQEPTMLKLQKLVQQTRLRLGLKTILENPPMYSHALNGAVENAVQWIRGLSNTLLFHLRSKSGLAFSHSHPLVAWSWQQAAWLLNHYSVSHGATPYELLAGHGYTGKTLMFGEPVLAYTAIEGVTNKGQAKWTRCLFLGKSNLNDMYICGCEGRIQLTRSVRRNVTDWAQHVELYMNFNLAPWNISGVVGSKLLPEVRKPNSGPIALDMESFGLQTPVSSGFQTPRLSLAQRKRQVPQTPLPELERVAESPRDEVASDPPSPSSLSMSPSLAPSLPEADVGVKTEAQEQAGPSSSSLKRSSADEQQQAAKRMTGMPSSAAKSVRVDAPERKEPETAKRQKEASSKRQKTRRVEVEPMHHDVNDFSDWLDVDPETIDPCEDVDSSTNYTFDPEAVNRRVDLQVCRAWPRTSLRHVWTWGIGPSCRPSRSISADWYGSVAPGWKPYGSSDARIGQGFEQAVECQVCSHMATQVWWQRFYWLRRSRAVAREFQFLEEREDVYSPASSSSLVRLLPAMLVSGQFPKHWVLCSFDVSDAYLMVPQDNLRWTRFIDNGDSFVIARCLPGQRDGAKRRFNFFTDDLEEQHSVDTCLECPALLPGQAVSHAHSCWWCFDVLWPPMAWQWVSPESQWKVQGELQGRQERGWQCGLLKTQVHHTRWWDPCDTINTSHQSLGWKVCNTQWRSWCTTGKDSMSPSFVSERRLRFVGWLKRPQRFAPWWA